MNNTFENLKKFFEEIKEVNLLTRIFGWKNIKKLSYEAYSEFESLAIIPKELEKEKTSLELTKKDNENLKNNYSKIEAQLQTLNQNYNQLLKENTNYKQNEENRKKEYEKNITEINTLRNSIEFDRQKIQQEKEEEIKNRFERQKLTWAKHEITTEETIKEICRKHTVEYIDKEKVPFKGKPDNTVKICEEYVIFDAKSPANDDLSNFPLYIKNQTESVKKYIKESDVKKDIFLVIPSNTVNVIKQFTYNMGDYNVYIVTIDSLEPIILSLQKIEEYEFAEQLSPEDRDNICRVIGKFVHTTKRKIEIDSFFNYQFLSIIKKAEIDLPQEILERVVEFEISEKLNPPTEKRTKQILTSELEKDINKLSSSGSSPELSTLELEKPKLNTEE